MNENDIKDFVDLFYPYIYKKIKKEQEFQNCLKITNAIVVSYDTENNIVVVKFPYEDVTFSAVNWSGDNLVEGDFVCLGYWIDLKNSIVLKKVKE